MKNTNKKKVTVHKSNKNLFLRIAVLVIAFALVAGIIMMPILS